MKLPRLDDLAGVAPGTRVLARLDLNVPLSDGRVADATRVHAAIPTLRWLSERGAIAAACSHLGKPGGKVEARFSLEPVAPVLSQALKRDVRYVPDCVGDLRDTALDDADPGDVLLLENLRFHVGEKKNDDGFAEELSRPFSHYVNDAFGTAHRAHASVEAVPRRFEPDRRAVGRLMEAELDALNRVVHDPEQPFVAAVGGAKISTKTGPLRTLVDRAETVLLGGGMANTFLVARGRDVGRSLVEDDMVDAAREIMEQAEGSGTRLVLPDDVVVTDDLHSPEMVDTVQADQIPADRLAVDIGPATIERFRDVISGAATVFWNGPMGVFEVERFARGTEAVAEAVAASSAFSVVGGGESAMAVRQAGVTDRIDHVSTGGGASLKLVAGNELPALAALGVT